jgi:hypothetical protein
MSREVFTTCSPLAVNCVLYQESGLINPWGAGVYYDGGTCWVVNSSGVITGTSTCEPTPTPTPTPSPLPPTIYTQFSDCASASWYIEGDYSSGVYISTNASGNCLFFIDLTETPSGDVLTNIESAESCNCP